MSITIVISLQSGLKYKVKAQYSVRYKMDDSTNGLHENGDVISHNEDVVNANEMQNIEENKEEECKIDPDSEKPGSSAEPKRIVEEPVLQRAEAPIVACPLFGVVVARTGMRRIVSNKSFSQSDMEDE
ncbi:Hypothetical predicted protein, partial [Paramuricea clavata]